MTDRAEKPWNETEARALVRALLDSGEFGVILLAPDGVVRRWSLGACKILGYGESEIVGRPFDTIFTEEDLARGAHLQELRAAREVGISQDERWHVRKDGARVWATGATLPWRAEPDGSQVRLAPRGEGPIDPDGFVKIVRDATHLRVRIGYLENEVREAMARHAQTALFIGTTAHELRNPLAPLKGSHYLLKSMSAGLPQMQHPLEVIERQIASLERLVEDLVDLTRANAGTLSLAYERVALQDVVAEAQEVCGVAAAAKAIDLQLIVPDTPVHAEVDRDRLRQVFVNLFTNAIKFSNPGGKVWVTLTVEDSHFLLMVRDHGRGIGPELLPRVFDAFTRASAADSRRGAGMGLGLVVVKEIVNAHLGTVEVRSDGEGLGSEFMVRMPLKRPQA